MNDRFKIYIDRLKSGDKELIDESLDPEILEISEKELEFKGPIQVKGEAYTAEDDLIICLSVGATAYLPCSVCNEMTKIEIVMDKFYHTVELKKIKESIYDFKAPLREQILLEIPQFAECEGKCPERKNIEQFLKKDQKDVKENYYPFSNLD